MNEVTLSPEEQAEYDALLNRAEMLGLKIHPKTGLEKLRIKVNNAIEGEKNEEELQEKSEPEVPKKAKVVAKKKKANYKMLTHEQFLKERSDSIKKNINRLVRIRVTCMNPNKSQWEGEIISVGSAKLGTFKKYIPFNAEEGWHVPQIIVEALKERKYTQFYTVRGPQGQKIRKGKLVPEFNIEILPPLTPDQIKELARKQAMQNAAD
jgi:hypothetical protein